MRLKSRTKFPAGGFHVLVPEAGMKAPFSGSFSEAVQFLYNFRRKNPALVQKNGWSLDIHDIEEDVDRYNAQRMVAAGYLNFVDIEGDVPVQKKTSSPGFFRSAKGVVAKARTALSMYHQMFGSDGRVVPVAEAERRAAICLVCPEHDTTGGLQKYFIKEAANELMGLFGMLKDMEVKTSMDDKMGVCQICSCAMRAKVFTESEVIKKNMKPEEIAKLPSNCWIPPAISIA